MCKSKKYVLHNLHCTIFIVTQNMSFLFFYEYLKFWIAVSRIMVMHVYGQGLKHMVRHVHIYYFLSDSRIIIRGSFLTFFIRNYSEIFCQKDLLKHCNLYSKHVCGKYKKFVVQLLFTTAKNNKAPQKKIKKSKYIFYKYLENCFFNIKKYY